MLKSCKYCGRIHDSRKRCGSRPVKTKKSTEQNRFRSTTEWQQMREEIQQRDNHLCQLCLRGLHGAMRRYVYDGTSVHHIVPLVEDKTRGLDESNLITLCEYHHRMAEAGKIERRELFAIVRQMKHPPGGEF